MQLKIRRALEREFGGYWWKVWGGPFQPAGIPDLCGIVGGRAVFVEVKMPKGKLRRSQELTMAKLIKEGQAIVCVAQSVAEALYLVDLGLNHVVRRPRPSTLDKA